MFRKIILDNFQSHKHTELDLSKGVNAITGKSDSGKTAIIRAILWVFENRPLGDDYVSHWSYKQGKIDPPTKVSIELSDGTMITRTKGNGVNSYSIDDVTFNAVGTDVPKEVSDLLNLTAVNIQSQLDPHFLLSETGGKVAEFLNSVIKLDIIDKSLATAEKERRRVQRTLDTTKKDIESTIENKKQFDWVGDADEIISGMEVVSDRQEASYAMVQTLEGMLGRYSDYETFIRELPSIQEATRLCRLTNENIATSNRIEENILQLEKSLDSYNNAAASLPSISTARAIQLVNDLQDTLVEHAATTATISIGNHTLHKWHTLVEQFNLYFTPITGGTRIVDSIKEVSSSLVLVNEKLQDLTSPDGTMGKCINAIEELQDIKKERAELMENYPEVCPLCGQPIGEGHV